jgi:S-methylmethionine-dependent homocysteine/selenocysteine methylase
MQVTSKPIVVYPNSGECYDGIKKEWIVSYCIPQLHTFEVITCSVA